MSTRRRLMMQSGGIRTHRYMQFDGNGVFDTGIVCNDTTEVEIKVKIDRHPYSDYLLMGVRKGVNTNSFALYYFQSGTRLFKCINQSYAVSNANKIIGTNDTNDFNTFFCSNTKAKLNNRENPLPGFSGFNTSPYTFHIGVAQTSTTKPSSSQFYGKIEYVKIKHNGEEYLFKAYKDDVFVDVNHGVFYPNMHKIGGTKAMD